MNRAEPGPEHTAGNDPVVADPSLAPPLTGHTAPGARALTAGSGRRRQGEDRILSLPNVVTTVRIVFIPVFVWLLVQPAQRWHAAVLLAVLGSTDWVDGQLARRLDQVTNLGKVLDPTADRALLATAVIGILAVGAVPLPIAIGAMAREGAVAVAAVVLWRLGARRIDVTLVGKAGTFGMMCAFPFFLAGDSTVGWHRVASDLGWVCGVAGLAFGWASVALYVPLARAALHDVDHAKT